MRGVPGRVMSTRTARVVLAFLGILALSPVLPARGGLLRPTCSGTSRGAIRFQIEPKDEMKKGALCHLIVQMR
jgi:hypothetical protein